MNPLDIIALTDATTLNVGRDRSPDDVRRYFAASVIRRHYRRTFPIPRPAVGGPGTCLTNGADRWSGD